ncbi:DUF6308 family protein [Micromonospora orduensis]|uniref:DUF6308 family protein n=1 Tax=Micromonospora orduensis TaxID=1420891 RepID=UPI003631D0DC
MTDELSLGEVPEGWPVPQGDALAAARGAALEALEDTERAGRRLARYYDPLGKFAGETFLTIAPNDPGQITAADLFAVTLLSIQLRPAAARRVLDDERHRDALHRSLAAVPDSACLADADAPTLARASALYDDVKRALARPGAAKSDPWVTASKLSARKRPRLIPVRDKKVRKLLGIPPGTDYRHDWLIHRGLMRDPTLLDRLREARDEATTSGGMQTSISDSSLRVLDVVLWTHAIDLAA